MTSMDSTTNPDSSGAGSSPFPETLWEQVLRAAQDDSPAAQEALRSICAVYHQPIVYGRSN